jgi:hypothetical protein
MPFTKFLLSRLFFNNGLRRSQKVLPFPVKSANLRNLRMKTARISPVE